MEQKIYWHGTPSKKNVESILKNGFKPGTWFAKHLEDAIEFGGKYIFTVTVEWQGENAHDWQICSANKITPDHILRVEKIESVVLYENKEALLRLNN